VFNLVPVRALPGADFAGFPGDGGGFVDTGFGGQRPVGIDKKLTEQDTRRPTMKRLATIVAIAVVTGVVGCTSMTPAQQGTMSGAAIGGAAGAGIAAIAGGNAWTGAAVGAIAGGIAGHIKGSTQQ
jgi:hypothetical protein